MRPALALWLLLCGVIVGGPGGLLIGLAAVLVWVAQ